MNLDKAKEEFIKYTNSYKNLNQMCELKIKHTFRVMDLCSKIAQSLNLSKEDEELAVLCGLLHDIGRFEQWRLYETFNDQESKDHAKIGISVLKKNKYINSFNDNEFYNNTILNSVYYHNKYSISKKLSERDQLFCKIIRDADKIDILYLCSIKQIKYNLQDEGFSEKVYKNLMKGKLIRKGFRENKKDLLAIPLGFIYDINFKHSIELIKENDYLNQIVEKYKKEVNNKEMQNQLESIKEKINSYIEERLSC